MLFFNLVEAINLLISLYIFHTSNIMKIKKKQWSLQNTDPHEVLYIPHGFDVFSFFACLFWRKNDVNKWWNLRSGDDFWSQKSMQQLWLFGSMRNRISYCKNNGLRRFWELRSHRKWEEKRMSFWRKIIRTKIGLQVSMIKW